MEDRKPIGESETTLSLNKTLSSLSARGTRREGGTTGAPGLESPAGKLEPLQRCHLSWGGGRNTLFSPFFLFSIILSMPSIYATQPEAIWHGSLET